MGMAVVLFPIFTEVNSKFRTGCRTHLSHYPQSFFINPRCPLGVALEVAASIDVRSGEVTNASEREAPAVVLETDNNEVGEHLFVAKVGAGNKPIFSAQSNQGE